MSSVIEYFPLNAISFHWLFACPPKGILSNCQSNWPLDSFCLLFWLQLTRALSAQKDDAHPVAEPAPGSHPEAGQVPVPDEPPQPPGKRQKVERVDLQSSHEQRGAQMSDAEIIRKLWGFVVPTDKPEFRTRVGISMAFLVASKGLNVAVSSSNPLLPSLPSDFHILGSYSGRFLCLSD